MPVHNRFSFADESVLTVVEQTHRPIELIIVDDLSNEPYVPKFSSEPNFTVKILRHEENLGPGASRETGRLAAHGDYIAYLDSDDLWHPQKLEKQVAMLGAHPEAGMCYCKAILFSKLPLTGNEPFRKNSNLFFSNFLPIVLDVRPWGTSACLWTRDASEKIGSWFNGWNFEDIEYDTRAGCHKIDICYIPEVMCYYRSEENDNSLSKSSGKFFVRQQTRSEIQIGKDLKQFNKIKEKDVHFFYTKRLFKTAFKAIDIGDKKSAIKLFYKLIEVSNGINKKMIALCLLYSCVIFPVFFLPRLKYRLKILRTKYQVQP